MVYTCSEWQGKLLLTGRMTYVCKVSRASVNCVMVICTHQQCVSTSARNVYRTFRPLASALDCIFVMSFVMIL